MWTQYLKHLAINTPLEHVGQSASRALSFAKSLRNPELTSLHDEPRHIDSACRLLLRPESNVIDVGAHLGSQLGVFTSLARQGRHIAFEPVPHKARWLRRKFPGVAVHELALHETSGVQQFFVNVSRPGYSGLRPHEAAQDELQPITVEQRRLDEVVDQDFDVDLIKIDVEGAELFVLRGATRLLTRSRPTLLFESTSSGLRTWNLSPDSLFDFLREHDYQVYLPCSFVHGGAALEQDEFAVAHQYPFRAFNFIAVARDRPLGRRRINTPRVVAHEPTLSGATG